MKKITRCFSCERCFSFSRVTWRVIFAGIGLAGAFFLIAVFFSTRENPPQKTSPQEDSAAKDAALVIADSGSGRVYGRYQTKENDLFSVEFIHSVNNSPVQEFFRVKGKEIYSESVRFSSFGAGMLSDLEEGLEMKQEGDELVISGFNRGFTELNYIVGTVSDHILIINNERISLRDLCGRNAHVSLYILRSR